jgi:hypothetical protein
LAAAHILLRAGPCFGAPEPRCGGMPFQFVDVQVTAEVGCPFLFFFFY